MQVFQREDSTWYTSKSRVCLNLMSDLFGLFYQWGTGRNEASEAPAEMIQRSVSYSFKKPGTAPGALWEHGLMLGTWRNTKLEDYDPCHVWENTPWQFLLKRCSEWSLSLLQWVWCVHIAPAKCLLLLDWWWLCQKPEFYRGHVRCTLALSLFHSLPCRVFFSWRKKKRFKENTKICVPSSNSILVSLYPIL